jgi:glyoxylase-like metal-dependent hydrolase (beta-lactamase superfamily II)
MRAAGLTVLLAGLWVAWSQAQQALKLEKVAGDLHVLIGDGGNVAILPTPEGVILVDDKFPRNAEEIRAHVKSLSDRPVRYVLNTHHHSDHTGGNEALLGAAAEVLMHRNARANVLRNKQPGAGRLAFADEALVSLGNREVLARHLGRGHTDGDAIVYFPRERVVHMGDLYVVANFPFIDYTSGGSAVEWDKTLERVLQMDFDIVIPGHGPVSRKADLAAWRKTFTAARARFKERCAAGVEEARKTAVDDLGWRTGPMFERSINELCAELAGAAR